jgi:uncharacterized protein (TIGR00730 family)
MSRICVFCGSSEGNRPVYRERASEVGRALAERNIGVVYGGGNTGLMGALADAALVAGGEVIGVIPRRLAEREVAHAGLTQLHVVETMHERKALMTELSDAFLTLPGGFGTLDELFEAITWRQLGFHDKRCGILDIDGYFDGLLAFVDRAVSDGFIHPADGARFLRGDATGALLDELLAPGSVDLRQISTSPVK